MSVVRATTYTSDENRRDSEDLRDSFYKLHLAPEQRTQQRESYVHLSAKTPSLTEISE